MLSLSHILHSFFFSLLLSLFYPLPVSSYPFFIQHLFSFAISIFISALRVPQDTPLPLPLSIHPSPYPFFPFYHFPTSANPFIANNFSLVQSLSSFLFPSFLSFFYYFPYILTLQYLSSKIYLPFSSLLFYLFLSLPIHSYPTPIIYSISLALPFFSIIFQPLPIHSYPTTFLLHNFYPPFCLPARAVHEPYQPLFPPSHPPVERVQVNPPYGKQHVPRQDGRA